MPLGAPQDVLIQHLVTCALGGGFCPTQLRDEVREHARLCDADRRRMAVRARFRRARRREPQRVSGIPARRHRRGRRRHRARRAHRAAAPDRHRHDRLGGEHHRALSQRRGARPRRGRLHRPPRARRLLRLRRPRAGARPRARAHRLGHARRTASSALVPRWTGSKMALSTKLAEATRALIAGARRGEFASPEMQLVRPLLELQRALVGASRRAANG